MVVLLQNVAYCGCIYGHAGCRTYLLTLTQCGCRPWYNVVVDYDMMWLWCCKLWHIAVVWLQLRPMVQCGCVVADHDTMWLVVADHDPIWLCCCKLWHSVVMLLQTMTQYGSVVANYDTVWLCGYRPWHDVVVLMQIMTQCSYLVMDPGML